MSVWRKAACIAWIVVGRAAAEKAMYIPVMELLAHICINRELDSTPPRALKRVVKQSLRKMFEPLFGDKVVYAVERLVMAAKTFDLVREDGDYLLAIIKSKEISEPK